MFILLTILTSIFVGILLGIFTGLIPGIHVNLIAVSLLTLSPLLLEFASPLTLSLVIVGMAITHTFLSTIPSIFLGAPDSDNVLSVLPGHKLLLEGKGYEAVALTVVGSLASLLLCIAIIPLLMMFIDFSYPFLKEKIGFILVVASVFLLYKEKNGHLWALIVFLLAGVLGIIVLTGSLTSNPLFPLLSGLFGISSLLISLSSNTKIPPQVVSNPSLPTSEGIQAISISVVIGSLCSTLPGLGPAQAAIIGSQFMKKSNAKSFLVLVGGLSTVNMIASFVTLYLIDKARNGAVITISQILTSLSKTEFIVLVAASLITGGFATILALKLTKVFSRVMCKINYRTLCISIISLITILVVILSGFFGLLILIVATCLGIVPPLKNVGRNHLMGCLLLPIILFFLL
tara:strand:+ start:18130 stop:19338 length:1209 start_codon:yes stop_codon:yes gene_type:complete